MYSSFSMSWKNIWPIWIWESRRSQRSQFSWLGFDFNLYYKGINWPGSLINAERKWDFSSETKFLTTYSTKGSINTSKSVTSLCFPSLIAVTPSVLIGPPNTVTCIIKEEHWVGGDCPCTSRVTIRTLIFVSKKTALLPSNKAIH